MTKYELRRYRFIVAEIKQLECEIKEIRSIMTSPKNQVITGMPRGGGVNDKMGDLIAKVERLEKRYEKKLNELISERERIEETIENLECRERQLIRYKYINCLTWEDVADKMNYSLVQIYRIHGKILQKIKDDIK